MLCYKCGTQLAEGANVCVVCGTPVNSKYLVPVCRKCGEPVQGDFCEKCGTKVSLESQNNNANSNRGLYAAMIVIGSCALLVIIAMVAMIITYSMRKNKSNDEFQGSLNDFEVLNETNSTYPEDAVEKLPERGDEKPTVPSEDEDSSIPSDGPESVTWITSVYSDLNIECTIPKHFVYDINASSSNNAVFKSPNGRAVMSLEKRYDSEGMSAEEALNEFLNTMQRSGGRVHYRVYKSGFYAASLLFDDREIYRKCFVDGNYLRWFEFSMPIEHMDYYSDYIEYIEDNFRVVAEDPTDYTD